MQRAVPTEGTFNEKMRLDNLQIFNVNLEDKHVSNNLNTSTSQQNHIMEVEEAELKQGDISQPLQHHL
jgi:hypothetical protein